ncbi:OmpP1/FadL family transporter [Hymenobacter cavernae]|uniref:Membrane protein n=1 Tax=Hymenobacter cavernae TaxID=2044852 RepID=A0ABQ1TVL4_9BACT|nr:hypothetical protein [Hymenobacter cavernae]GGF02748.1 membrane protein [Hymenobacter cavernae]
MWKNKFAGLVGLTLVGLVAAPRSQGQGLGNSPYSRLGLGDANPNTGGVRQLGMGGVGLAAPNGVHVNDLNPALIYYTSRTTFEMALNGQFHTVSNRLESQRDGSATLGYLAFSVPISKWWAASAGLRPYSAVDYNSTSTGSVAGDPTAQTLEQNTGTGGLAEAHMSHAFRLAKGLTVGGTASYVFGSIDLASGVLLNKASVQTQINTIEHVHYSDFTYRVGAHYRNKLNSKINYNLAGVYTFQSHLNGFRNTSVERQDAGVITNTTPQVTDQQGEAVVPALAQAGISLDNNKNWSINVDVAQQQWSKFRSFGVAGGATTGVPLNDTWRAGIGGEIAPDPGSVESYFKRVSYRAGISVAQMPYRPDGKMMYDRAVSWGFSFPLPTATALDATTINLGFSYGQRGNTAKSIENPSGNIKENYVKAQLGVTLNNRWFLKRRIE